MRLARDGAASRCTGAAAFNVAESAASAASFGPATVRPPDSRGGEAVELRGATILSIAQGYARRERTAIRAHRYAGNWRRAPGRRSEFLAGIAAHVGIVVDLLGLVVGALVVALALFLLHMDFARLAQLILEKADLVLRQHAAGGER